MKTTNPYDQKFRKYLIKKGYNLNTISLSEAVKELKIYNNKHEIRN
jgi:CRISPR/Cas system-associated protein endoribonuclease Cas2